MAKNMAWAKAIQEVLKDAGTPMHTGDIAEAIVSNGLKAKVGATPGNSVAATIAMSKKKW
jgi:hypothetical protein